MKRIYQRQAAWGTCTQTGERDIQTLELTLLLSLVCLETMSRSRHILSLILERYFFSIKLCTFLLSGSRTSPSPSSSSKLLNEGMGPDRGEDLNLDEGGEEGMGASFGFPELQSTHKNRRMNE